MLEFYVLLDSLNESTRHTGPLSIFVKHQVTILKFPCTRKLPRQHQRNLCYYFKRIAFCFGSEIWQINWANSMIIITIYIIYTYLEYEIETLSFDIKLGNRCKSNPPCWILLTLHKLSHAEFEEEASDTSSIRIL